MRTREKGERERRGEDDEVEGGRDAANERVLFSSSSSFSASKPPCPTSTPWSFWLPGSPSGTCKRLPRSPSATLSSPSTRNRPACVSDAIGAEEEGTTGGRGDDDRSAASVAFAARGTPRSFAPSIAETRASRVQFRAPFFSPRSGPSANVKAGPYAITRFDFEEKMASGLS